MRTPHRTIAIIGAAALLAACGGDGESFADQPAKDIIEATKADMEALSSLRMSGELVTDGEQVEIDMAISTDGDCAGSVGQQGGTAEIISIGGTSYMKPDAAFWELFAGEGASSIVELVGDRWVAVPGDAGEFAAFCDLDQLLDELRADDDQDEDAEVEGTEEIDGKEAVRISSTSDDGEPVTVWVAADSPHVILQMEVTEGDEPGTIRFSEFDAPIDVEAPAGDDVVDLDELG